MGGGDVRSVPEADLTTTEVLKASGCTRSRFARYRRVYGGFTPSRTIPPCTHLWPAHVVDLVRDLLALEVSGPFA